MQSNLTESQNDYAVFLPSISGFYATFIGKQRYSEYVDYNRIPAGLGSVEALNFLNSKDGAFKYKWALYSAGHAELDTAKISEKEDMVRKRDRESSWLLGDSGGFQIAKGLWEGDWTDPNCPRAQKKRELVINWMEEYMDYGMMLDIPTWTFRDPKASEASNIKSYQDAVNATHINAKFYMANRRGNFKVLNVLQGGNHTEADEWYEEFKDYCDPKKYPDTHFNGWAMGGQNMCDVHLILRRLVTMMYDGLLEPGVHDVMHFLGTSKLEWAVLLTDIQRAVRKYHNPNFMITYDCASPFLATANGQVYHSIRIEDRGKWSYMMAPSVDDKSYSNDTRSFREVYIEHKINEANLIEKKEAREEALSKIGFEDSPISQHCSAKDICIYKPGDLNKIGKEGRTSWDSFSYALQMGHNVWMHIESTQRANRMYDAGQYPYMLIDEKFKTVTFRDAVDEIFSQKDKAKSLAAIEKYNRFWMQVIGTRLNVGKKTVNASTQFNKLFDIEYTEITDEMLAEREAALPAPTVTKKKKDSSPVILNESLFEVK
jgi:hypothetical protein